MAVGEQRSGHRNHALRMRAQALGQHDPAQRRHAPARPAQPEQERGQGEAGQFRGRDHGSAAAAQPCRRRTGQGGGRAGRREHGDQQGGTGHQAGERPAQRPRRRQPSRRGRRIVSGQILPGQATPGEAAQGDGQPGEQQPSFRAGQPQRRRAQRGGGSRRVQPGAGTHLPDRSTSGESSGGSREERAEGAEGGGGEGTPRVSRWRVRKARSAPLAVRASAAS